MTVNRSLNFYNGGFLRETEELIEGKTNECFAKEEVTADQFVLLSALADSDAVTQQELVWRVNSDPNTVRAMLLLLEGRGLVARERHPSDSRARCVRLTVKGRQAFRKLWTKSEPLRARLGGAFQPDEVTALLGLLRRVGEVIVSPASNGSRTTATPSSPAKNTIEH